MKSYIVDRCPHCAGTLRQRSTEQNAKLHALLMDISEQKEWAGKMIDAETWKRLLIAGFCRANKQSAEFYPAVDGQGFDIVYRRSSRMTKQELSELIEYCTAWAIDQGVRLRDPVSA